MDTDSFIDFTKQNIYVDIAKTLKRNMKLQIMNQTDHHQNELGGKIMTEFATLRTKTSSYQRHNNKHRTVKGAKNFVK